MALLSLNNTGINANYSSPWIVDKGGLKEIDNAEFKQDAPKGIYQRLRKLSLQIEYKNATGTLDGEIQIWASLSGKESKIATIAIDAANNSSDTHLEVLDFLITGWRYKVVINNLTNVDVEINQLRDNL